MTNRLSSPFVAITCLAFLMVLQSLANADELDRLRNLRNVQVKQIDKKYVEALKKLKAVYMKAQALEQAVIVENEIKRVEGGRSNVGQLGPLAKVNSKDSANVIASGEFLEFKDGGLAYGNRGYRWKDVSRKYSSWEILKRNGSSGGAEATLEFQVVSDGLVNILIGADDYDSFSKLGWKKSGECGSSASPKDRFFIIKKALPAGRYSVKTNTFMAARVVRRKEKKN